MFCNFFFSHFPIVFLINMSIPCSNITLFCLILKLKNLSKSTLFDNLDYIVTCKRIINMNLEECGR